MSTRIRTLLTACASVLMAACGDGPTAPTPGTIKLDVFTSGGDPDLDGYEIVVGAEKRFIMTSSTLRFDGVAAGPQLVEVRGVADNCSVVGENPRTVVVQPRAETSALIEVACDATGIEMQFRTAGPAIPLLGYTVRAAGRAFLAQPNGTVTISGLPPGSHPVTVTAPEGCTVPGGSSLAVNVIHRRLTPVTIEVTCISNPIVIAFAFDSIINRSYSRWIAATSMTEGAVPTPLLQGYDPAWSPDGKRLAYSTTVCDYYYGYGCTGGLAIMDYTTGNQSAPASFRAGVSPSWSPDGKSIAFISFDPNYAGKVTVAALDGPPNVLPLNVNSAWSPNWSPVSNRIVFQCLMTGSDKSDICLVNSDGSAFLRLTSDTVYQSSPKWSPDGRTIAFVNTLTSGPWIMAMDADGSNVRQLVAGWQPSWSPDGSKLVFARNDGLFVSDADGSQVSRISTGSHHAPSWRP